MGDSFGTGEEAPRIEFKRSLFLLVIGLQSVVEAKILKNSGKLDILTEVERFSETLYSNRHHWPGLRVQFTLSSVASYFNHPQLSC